MKLWNVFRWSSLFLLALFAFLPFQNCSEVKFDPTQAALDKADLANKKACVVDGVNHVHGSKWSNVVLSEQQLPCPDGPMRIQGYSTTLGYACDDGDVVATDTTVIPTNTVPQCPAPSLKAELAPPVVVEGQTADLNVTSEYLSAVSYSCYEGLNVPDPTAVAVRTGSLSIGIANVKMPVTQDLFCRVEGMNSAMFKLQADVKVSVDCGNRIKENGKCRDFKCTKIVPIELAAGETLLQVPARTAEGLCYSMKLMDKIANSSSALTTLVDEEVISRTHGQAATPTRKPFVLGKSLINFVLAGARNVRLNGADDELTKIRIDNFALVGLIPSADAAKTDLEKTAFYRSYGTSDSTIPGTDYILFRDQRITLASFGAGGTSTITPLDITAEVKPLMPYQLDVRALDCGGSRELSDIYLLFQ